MTPPVPAEAVARIASYTEEAERDGVVVLTVATADLRALLADYADAARDREIVDAMESGRVSFYGMPSQIGGGFGAQDTATMTVTDGATVRGIWKHLERIRLDAARTGEAR